MHIDDVAREVSRRFVTPATGGWPTDPKWTKRRLVRFAPKTIARLNRLARLVSERAGVNVSPFQLAALLLELEIGKD
jgi:hypothetical protein